MNITKLILKNKTIQIIADDNTDVNNQTLEGLVKKNLKVLAQNNIKRNDNVKEPEDHISILFDMMSGLIRGNFNERYFSLSGCLAYFGYIQLEPIKINFLIPFMYDP